MDKKHKKRLKRAHKKKVKGASRHDQESLRAQLNLFDKLPSHCSACQSPFPQTREAHTTWQVMVRTAEKLVRLFCPECQAKATKVVEEQNEI